MAEDPPQGCRMTGSRATPRIWRAQIARRLAGKGQELSDAQRITFRGARRVGFAACCGMRFFQRLTANVPDVAVGRRLIAGFQERSLIHSVHQEEFEHGGGISKSHSGSSTKAAGK